MKPHLSTEHSEQVGFCHWFACKFPGVVMFSIPNGELRAKSVAVRLKKEGLTKGVPDLFIPRWKLFVEMKRSDGGRVSDEQFKMMMYLKECGYEVIIGYGAEDASRKVLDFMKVKRNEV